MCGAAAVIHHRCVTVQWYRWSETPVSIDFRAIAGNPAAPWGVGNATDIERISNLAAKTVIPYGEIPTGSAYSFYPTGVGSNAPLFNAQRNEFVAVTNVNPASRALVDFFATGDSLLASHTNNLALVSQTVTAAYDAPSGCTILNGVGAPVAFPTTSGSAGVAVSAVAAVAALVASAFATAA